MSTHTTSKRTRLYAAAGIVAAAVALAGCGGSGSSSTKTISVTPISPVSLSLSGLQTLARVVPNPIYWAGPKPSVQYELRRTSTGNVYVRYLPKTAKVGTSRTGFLVVATYPFDGAFDALKKVAGSSAVQIPDGGVAYPDPKNGKSVHVAFPDSNSQVEVYSRSATESLQVARSGLVRPIK